MQTCWRRASMWIVLRLFEQALCSLGRCCASFGRSLAACFHSLFANCSLRSGRIDFWKLLSSILMDKGPVPSSWTCFCHASPWTRPRPKPALRWWSPCFRSCLLGWRNRSSDIVQSTCPPSTNCINAAKYLDRVPRNHSAASDSPWDPGLTWNGHRCPTRQHRLRSCAARAGLHFQFLAAFGTIMYSQIYDLWPLRGSFEVTIHLSTIAVAAPSRRRHLCCWSQVVLGGCRSGRNSWNRTILPTILHRWCTAIACWMNSWSRSTALCPGPYLWIRSHCRLRFRLLRCGGIPIWFVFTLWVRFSCNNCCKTSSFIFIWPIFCALQRSFLLACVLGRCRPRRSHHRLIP